jgi:S-adenosylmethionine-diacylgycerolhomoserine-N-methlytransferase
VNLHRYYRLHAPIYDWTRWSFLFGRQELVERLARGPAPSRILEIGCGTGANLLALAQSFPQAQLSGMDLSEHMLRRARKKLARFGDRIRLFQGRYPEDEAFPGAERPFDLIVFSYTLTMFGDGWGPALEAARNALSTRGQVAAIDFHESRLPGFRRWMSLNHVRVEGHLFPALTARFAARHSEVRSAFWGAWTYFLFIGAPAGKENRLGRQDST